MNELNQEQSIGVEYQAPLLQDEALRLISIIPLDRQPLAMALFQSANNHVSAEVRRLQLEREKVEVRKDDLQARLITDELFANRIAIYTDLVAVLRNEVSSSEDARDARLNPELYRWI